MMNKASDKYKNETSITADPSTSFWLKEQLYLTKQRDILDAVYDAELLLMVLWQRLTNQAPELAQWQSHDVTLQKTHDESSDFNNQYRVFIHDDGN